MSDNNKDLVIQQDVNLAEYGTREEVAALGRRLKVMVPGDLTETEAMALAQYSRLMDANPFRGEIYAFNSRGKLQLVEGYKLLIRWARRQCNYSEKYERLPDDEVPGGAVGYRCYILRDDAKQTLADFVKAGATFQDAYEIAAASAVGVALKNDNVPTGWTLDEVARKRALKNAINRAYGSPSPREIAQETWKVGEIETLPEDWADVEFEPGSYEREQEAASNAVARESASKVEGMTDEERQEMLERNRVILHGGPDWDSLPEEKLERRSWPAKFVKALTDENIVEGKVEAVALLNQSTFDPKSASVDEVLAWARGDAEEGE
jgi:hypothetical protein